MGGEDEVVCAGYAHRAPSMVRGPSWRRAKRAYPLCLGGAYFVLKSLQFGAFSCISFPLGAILVLSQLPDFHRFHLVVPAGIEPASPASETGALSIELRDLGMRGRGRGGWVWGPWADVSGVALAGDQGIVDGFVCN